jgi:hypothetical protein
MIQVDRPTNPLGARLHRLAAQLGIAASKANRHPLSIMLRLMDIWRRTGIRPGEALRLGLSDPAVSEATLSACFAKTKLVALQDALNPIELTCLTEDKSMFYPLCRSLGIPVPRTIAVLARGDGWIDGGDAVTGRESWVRRLAEILPNTFVTKPARGVYGDGVSVWTRVARGFADHHGRVHSTDELYQALVSHPRYERFVIQERLENHPDIVQLTGSSTLQTARVVTLVEPDGTPRLLAATWKVVQGSQAIDNFKQGTTGNLVENVDLHSGRLGPGLRYCPDGVGIQAVRVHPVTGYALEGARLPDWPAVVELVRRCALLFLPLRTIGWDVGLTPRGPVIVEGNRWWDPHNEEAVGGTQAGGEPDDLVAGAALLRRQGFCLAPACRCDRGRR